jgi:hypothetical protein
LSPFHQSLASVISNDVRSVSDDRQRSIAKADHIRREGCYRAAKLIL